MIRIGYRLYGVVICIIYLMKLYDMAPVLASYGDQLPQYRGCIRSCLPRRPCLNQSIWMSLLGWDDHAECSYRCMHEVSVERAASGLPVVKFHGKWPFRRILGFQDICSSVFCIFNLVPHAWYLWTPPWNSDHLLSSFMRLHSFFCVVMFVFAAIFHARDLKWTEATDYFSALLSLLYFVWLQIGVYWKSALIGIMVGFSFFYLYHIRLMSRHFDYGYHMKVAFYFSVLNATLIMIHWFRIRKRPYAVGMAAVIFLTHAAIILEVIEFPPLGDLLDAHAAWHLATSPLNFFIYWYQVKDLLWDCYEKSLHETTVAFQLKKKTQ